MKLRAVFQKIFLTKSFRIELDDENTYTCEKNFKFPTDDVIISAIVKYAEKNEEHIEFISYRKPITFWMESKKSSGILREKYRADLVKGSHPRNLGYYVMCYKVLNEDERN